MPLSVGDKLGHYEVLSLIGQGGMGEVYRARDTTLKRDVALKVLPATLLRDPERMARFQREAEVLASLDHPNIGPIYGIIDSEESRGLVLALIEGPTLSDQIALGPLPLDDALPIAKQIVEALEYAHDRGVVHRDLKPANIKITPEGVVKVLDFGLAKVIEDERPPVAGVDSPTLTIGHTQTGVILGTAAYMSPEQAVAKGVDRRSDIFSFGSVLFEMLTGERAFSGATAPEALISVAKDVPDWSKLPSRTPEWLRALLGRCLVKDRRRRLQAIGEARLILEKPPAIPAAIPFAAKTGWIAATVTALIAGFVGYGWWRAAHPIDQPLIRLEVELGSGVSLAAPNVSRKSIIISADGKRLAYLSGTPLKLFIRRLDQAKANELPGTEGARSAFFSPDGEWLAFVNNAGDKLNKVSVEGGAVVPLAESALLGSGVWGADGNIYVGQASVDGRNPAIVRVPAGGGAVETVVGPTSEQTVQDALQILPGDKAVLFSSYQPVKSGDADRNSIRVVVLADHKAKTIVPGASKARYVSSGHLIYSSDGTLFAIPFDLDRLETRGTATPILDDLAYTRGNRSSDFDVSAGPDGHGTLVYEAGGPVGLDVFAPSGTVHSIDTSGKRAPLVAKPGAYRYPHFSPDGKQLALVAGLRDSQFGIRNAGDVWVHNLTRDNATQLTRGDLYANPIWTPDGKYLVAAKLGSGMVWMRADGSSQPQELVLSKNLQVPTSIRRDGKWLVYSENASFRSPEALWTVPLSEEGGQLKASKPELFLENPESGLRYATFSPDGEWIAYTAFDGFSVRLRSQLPTQVAQDVYVRPFPASRERGQVKISNGGLNPMWSKNGEILYSSPSIGVMAVRYTVNAGNFEPAKPQLWLKEILTSEAGLDPDGKRLAIVVPDGTPESAPREGSKPSHTIIYLQNFFDELRRRAPLRN